MSSSKATQKRKTNIEDVVKKIYRDLASNDKNSQDGEKNGSDPSCEEKVAAANNKENNPPLDDEESRRRDAIWMAKKICEVESSPEKHAGETKRAANRNKATGVASTALSRKKKSAADSNKGIEPPSYDKIFLEKFQLKLQNASLLSENARLEALLRKQTAEINQFKKREEEMEKKLDVLTNDIREICEIAVKMTVENHRLMKEAE